MTRAPARIHPAIKNKPSCGTLLRNGTTGLPQATLTCEHSWFRQQTHRFLHTAFCRTAPEQLCFSQAKSSALQKGFSSFWPQCSWYLNSFTQNCDHIHLLSEHIPSPIPKACLLTERELEESRKHDFLYEPGFAALEKDIGYRRERNQR